MTTIKELRKQKQQWMQETLSANQLQKEFKLHPDEIKRIQKVTHYGKTRYIKKAVFKLLQLKDHNYVSVLQPKTYKKFIRSK